MVSRSLIFLGGAGSATQEVEGVTKWGQEVNPGTNMFNLNVCEARAIVSVDPTDQMGVASGPVTSSTCDILTQHVQESSSFFSRSVLAEANN